MDECNQIISMRLVSVKFEEKEIAHVSCVKTKTVKKK